MPLNVFRRFRRRSKATDSASSATERAIQTYELLEHILGYLDPTSLRRAQLASTYWHDVVHQSRSLGKRVKEPSKAHPLRILLVGASDFVTQSFVRCFVHGPYPPFHPPLGMVRGFYDNRLLVDDEQWTITVTETDTRDRYLGQAVANCDAIMLLYAGNSRASFERIHAWVSQLNSGTEPLTLLLTIGAAKRGSNFHLQNIIPAMVVSIDCHLNTSCREVQAEEGDALARTLGCPFIESSSITGDGVREAFEEICRMNKRAKMADMYAKSKRSSLLRGVPAPSLISDERKEKWWRWHRSRQLQSPPD